MKHGNYLKSVAIISLGGFAAKGIGALYRIPLVGALGGYGMGLYQMAYPLFCVLLTFSSAGIPSAFSRIIAGETARGMRTGGTVKTALSLFALLGLCGTALMCLFAPQMSGLQGDGNLLPCYFALAPSVFFVALIAVLRGYFQGRNDMVPTAVSEIVEQLVKASAGLLFAFRFADRPARAVACTLAAVTASEICAFLYLYVRYRREPRRGSLRVFKTGGAEILYTAFPVMAASALLPLSQTVDSVLIVRLLSRHTARAVSLYGLYAGGAVSLVSLPASVCYGLSAASVPVVSACFAAGREEEGRTRALWALLFTLALSVPCAIGLFVLARPAVSILYGGLSPEDAQTLVRLVRLSSVSAATLAGVDTLAACLTGMGRAKHAAVNMLFAVLIKFSLQWLLVGSPAFSVGGAAIASNACYLVAFFLDLLYTFKKKVGRKKHDYGDRAGRSARRLFGTRALKNEAGGQGVASHGKAALGGGLEGEGDRIRISRFPLRKKP
ncbi:MAG: polysaccharide biosynthesis protein [Clostridia bacterium]|nr:polysaccharide biosynthesis protein [Clostridia bacterium]